MVRFFSRQIFYMTFFIVFLIFILTGVTFINLLTYILFLTLFGLLSITYLVLNKRGVIIPDKFVYGHYTLTLLGCVPTYFVIYTMFSLISKTFDAGAIATQESLFKL